MLLITILMPSIHNSVRTCLKNSNSNPADFDCIIDKRSAKIRKVHLNAIYSINLKKTGKVKITCNEGECAEALLAQLSGRVK